MDVFYFFHYSPKPTPTPPYFSCEPSPNVKLVKSKNSISLLSIEPFNSSMYKLPCRTLAKFY